MAWIFQHGVSFLTYETLFLDTPLSSRDKMVASQLRVTLSHVTLLSIHRFLLTSLFLDWELVLAGAGGVLEETELHQAWANGWSAQVSKCVRCLLGQASPPSGQQHERNGVDRSFFSRYGGRLSRQSRFRLRAST
jgi:hypothetical protein